MPSETRDPLLQALLEVLYEIWPGSRKSKGPLRSA